MRKSGETVYDCEIIKIVYKPLSCGLYTNLVKSPDEVSAFNGNENAINSDQEDMCFETAKSYKVELLRYMLTGKVAGTVHEDWINSAEERTVYP